MQYRRLEDLMALEANDLGKQPSQNELLPVILPCALCSQQQMTASVVANQLKKKRIQPPIPTSVSANSPILKSSPIISERSEQSCNKDSVYEEFLEICGHVEIMLKQSLTQMASKRKMEGKYRVSKTRIYQKKCL